jgi:hypothetical protein
MPTSSSLGHPHVLDREITPALIPIVPRGSQLRGDRRFPAAHLAGCGFGVDRVGLAGVASRLAVRAVDLDDDHTTVV